jgi:hypothetical protein
MDADEIAKQLDQSKPVSITANGEIIRADETVETPEGLVDRNSGERVTALKPQRWYSWFKSNPGRLVNETAAMETLFPDFELHELPQGLAWVGFVTPEKTRGRYKVSVVYPDDFPYHPPKVFVLDPRISAPKHQYGDTSLCLMYPGDSTWGTNTTAGQAVAMASAWLFCYEYHEEHCPTRCRTVPCKYWPGNEAPH